jgi:hypothetical protein
MTKARNSGAQGTGIWLQITSAAWIGFVVVAYYFFQSIKLSAALAGLMRPAR